MPCESLADLPNDVQERLGADWVRRRQLTSERLSSTGRVALDHLFRLVRRRRPEAHPFPLGYTRATRPGVGRLSMVSPTGTAGMP